MTMMRATRRWLVATITLMAVLSVCLQAKADVRVVITPTSRTANVNTAATYAITTTTTTPILIDDVRGMLPGHGQPCGQPDEPGDPYGGDPTTKFTVTTPGVEVSGRTFTIPGPFYVTPGQPLEVDLGVETPGIAACFYAGATVDPASGFRGEAVTGTAQGGELDVDQADGFATGGSFGEIQPDGTVTLSWWTQSPSLVTSWRLGLPTGFTLLGASFGGAPVFRHARSFSAVWKGAWPAGTETVQLRVPCSGLGLTWIHARLRTTNQAGETTGTGNGGPGLQLPVC